MLLLSLHEKYSCSFAGSFILHIYLDLFKISVFYDHIIYFAFSRGKVCQVRDKRQLVQISSRLIAYIYTYVLCTHIQIYICRDSVHLDSSGPLSVSSRPLGSLQAFHVQCACVCVYTHIPAKTPNIQNSNLHLSIWSFQQSY